MSINAQDLEHLLKALNRATEKLQDVECRLSAIYGDIEEMQCELEQGNG